jgi:hypothetical protein
VIVEVIPQGHVGLRHGSKKVIITGDPENPKCTSRNRRVFYISTKRGKAYSEAVAKYLKVKNEYDLLLSSWRSLYSIPPPRINFPIIQFADPHRMNNEFFERQNDRRGKYKPDNPTISDHGELKSKNEQIGADLLKRLDIPFKYEPEVYLESIEEMINPDYLINFYEIDRCAYLEILGMNDKIGYTVKNSTKITGFSKDSYRPGREVIYVHIYDRNNFDEDYFVSQVLSAFNDMIPDSALVWETVPKAV